MTRVAILISHAHQEPFISLIERLQRPSRLKFEDFSFEVFYFEGRRSSPIEFWLRAKIERLRYSRFWPLLRIYDVVFLRLSSARLPVAKLEVDEIGQKFLKVDCPEDQRHIAVKLYSALYFCLEKEYDFVVRTTSNSLFNIEKLTQFMRERIDVGLLYAGREVKSLNRPSFISGSFLILNKDAIKELLLYRKYHNYGVLDDVAIGRLFTALGERVTKAFGSSIDLPNMNSITNLSSTEMRKAVHFRCKSDATPRNDSDVVLELTKLLEVSNIIYV